MTLRHLSIYIAFAFIISVLPSLAAVVGPSTRAVLAYNAIQADSRAASDDAPTHQPLILLIASDDAVDQLLQLGVTIYHRRDNMLLTAVPMAVVPQVLALAEVTNAQATLKVCTLLDRARPFGAVSSAQQGLQLPQPYNGAGVMVGFTDTGFDPTLPPFAGRIKGIFDYNAAYDRASLTTDPAEIAQCGTDNPDQYHATHVANILTGGCLDSPYYGVAYGADIAAATSRLTDVGILAGIDDIIDLARSQGKPAVINMSLGSCTGPHDGTDLMCRYLSLCADDAIICASAGNQGTTNISAQMTFSAANPVARIELMDSQTWKGFDIDGMIDAWGESGMPMAARLEVYDTADESIVYASPWLGEDGSEGVLTLNANIDILWGRYMAGKAVVSYGFDPLNRRYNVSAIFDTHTQAESPAGHWSRYRNVLALRGVEGSRVWMYCDAAGSYLGRVRVDGKISCRPSPDESISNLCTAQGVISVGSCTSRNSAPLLHGGECTWGYQVGTIADYTSYGHSYQGAALPMIAAPGNFVVSAMSNAYLDTHPEVYDNLSAEMMCDGQTFYYMAANGTSQAAPYTAGTIALWLQADPTLTAAQAREIAQLTAQTDYPDMANLRWGAGCIDAYAGLRYIIEHAALDSPTLQPIVTITPDRRLDITAPSGTPVCLYDINGRPLDPTLPLPRGIYLLQVGALPPQKIVI